MSSKVTPENVSMASEASKHSVCEYNSQESSGHTRMVGTTIRMNSMEGFYLVTLCENLLFEKFLRPFKVTPALTPPFGHHLPLRIILSVPLASPPLLQFLP